MAASSSSFKKEKEEDKVLDENEEGLPAIYNYLTEERMKRIKMFVLYHWYTSKNKDAGLPVVKIRKINGGSVGKTFHIISFEDDPVKSYLSHPDSRGLLLDIMKNRGKQFYYMIEVPDARDTCLYLIKDGFDPKYKQRNWESPASLAEFQASIPF